MSGVDGKVGAGGVNLVEVRDAHYTYLAGTPFATPALRGATARVVRGEFLGIVGPSRSGKSTLVQFFNGLLAPSRGEVRVGGEPISRESAALRRLRRQVGLVFQQPETQLFASTVAEDVAFGPRNFGFPNEQIGWRVDEALTRMRLDPAHYRDRDVSMLSGGEKRRVAIAGVLACAPELLVLDEPLAGLDPDTCAGLVEHLVELHAAGTTVVVVSGSAVEWAPLVDRLVVLRDGAVHAEGRPGEVLADEHLVRSTGIGIPDSLALLHRLRESGRPVPDGVFGPAETAAVIASVLADRAAEGGR
jgi:energy-coupling factor transport system ATP-binding protein